MFLENKGEVIAKLESTPYTGETLADADHNVRIDGPPTYSPNIEEYRRKILDGTLDKWTSVAGKRIGTVSFKVNLAPAGAAATPPAYFKLLQACMFKQTIHGATGVSLVPHTELTHSPITLEIQELAEGASPSMLVTRLVGAMGNVTFMVGQVGEPVNLQFEFSGALDSIADRAFGAKLDLTSPSTVVPPALMGVTLTLAGVAQDLDSMEINMNNVVSPWPDPSKNGGIKGHYISDYAPTAVFDPTLKLIATEDFWSQWTNETTGAISIAMGGSPALTISAPAAQYIQTGIGSREGSRTLEKTLLLTNNEFASTNAVFEVLQGSKT